MKIVYIYSVILFDIFNFSLGQVDQISSKLDFGDTTTNNYDATLSTNIVKAFVRLHQSSSGGPSKNIISSKLDQNPFTLGSIASGTNKDFTSILCVNNNCNDNSRNKQVANSEDKQSTDILVQISTNLEDQSSKNNITLLNQDQDVPIVVGYGGTNENPKIDIASRRLDGSQDVTIQTNPVGANQANSYNFYHVHKDNEHGTSDGLFQVQVPYFNNHFYEGNQPPQYVWHRRRNNFPINTLSFLTKSYKPPFNQWQLKFPSTQSPPVGWTGTTCSCTNPGLNWYPSFGPQKPTLTPSINNKLTPLT